MKKSLPKKTKKFARNLAIFLAIFFITIGVGFYLSMERATINIISSASVPSGSTIQSVINSSASGTTIRVPSGTYNERLNITKPVNVVCETPKACVIKGAILSGNALLDGFYVKDSSEYEGAVVMNGTGNIVRNNKVEGACMVGIILNDSNNLAERNEILKSRVCPVSGHSGFDADGIRFFGSNQVMRGNYIHDIFYDPTVNIDPHTDCFQTWEGSTDAIIEDNICDNYSSNSTRGTQGVELDSAKGTIIRHNLFHTYAKKIDLDVNNSNTLIENNIFVGGAKSPSSVAGQYGVFNAGGTATVVNNNIFYNIRAVADGSTPWIYQASSQSNNLPLDATSSRPVNPGVDPKLDSTWHPQTGSPACTGGVGGTYIGPYPCTNTPVLSSSTPSPTSTPTPTAKPSISPSPTPIPTPQSTDTTRPKLTITTGTSFGRFWIKAEASDASGIATISIMKDNSLIKTCTNKNSCTYKPGRVSRPYDVQVSVTDNSVAHNSTYGSIVIR